MQGKFLSVMNKYIIILIILICTDVRLQDLNELSFGDEHTLDIATWNIEWFQKNDETTD